MSTYLVAVTLLTTDYTYVERYHQSCRGQVRLRFWSRSRDARQLELAAFLAPKMIGFMEQVQLHSFKRSTIPQFMNMQMKYLDEPLAVSKIDFVPVPMAPNFQAMENWGLILITESFFFYDDQVLHFWHSFDG
jgi:aminopeptidase N